MLSQADASRLERIKNLYVNWLMNGDDKLSSECADLLVDCDDPQAVWEEHIAWDEETNGITVPEEYRDITGTVRIKQKLSRLN